jgi:hypothetical protein
MENIAYGETLIKHLDNEDWDLATECLSLYDGDIIGFNPKKDIEELFQHIRGSLDFRTVTKKELEEINKRITL